MKVILFTKYGSLAASTRYRFQQFEPFLKSQNVEVHRQALLENDYLHWKIQGGKFGIRQTIFAFFQRIVLLLCIRRFDLAIVHCELFPYLPSWGERWLRWKKVPFLYDFDDAIFHQYDCNKKALVRQLFSKKIARIIHYASGVYAGNQYLADYSKQFNKNVHIFPTVVDLNRYTEKKWDNKEALFTIGWIGSPSTAAFVREITPALKKFLETRKAKLVLIGAGKTEIPGLNYENVPWEEKSEIQNLHHFTVGIMPLREQTSWDKGKCAFKLIQYMACGIPVIGSRIGANIEVVPEEEVGFLATTTEEWLAALEKLYQNRELARRLGGNGRKRVEKLYSLQGIQVQWLEQMQKAAKTPC